MKTQKEVVRYREVSKDEKNLVPGFFVCFFNYKFDVHKLTFRF